MKRCLFYFKTFFFSFSTLLLSITSVQAAIFSGSVPIVVQEVNRASFDGSGSLVLNLVPVGGVDSAAIPIVLELNADAIRNGYFGILPYEDGDLPMMVGKTGCAEGVAFQVNRGTEAHVGTAGFIQFTLEEVVGGYSSDLVVSPDLLALKGTIDFRFESHLESPDRIMLRPLTEQWRVSCTSAVPRYEAPGKPVERIPGVSDAEPLPLPDSGEDGEGGDDTVVIPGLDPDDFLPPAAREIYPYPERLFPIPGDGGDGEDPERTDPGGEDPPPTIPIDPEVFDRPDIIPHPDRPVDLFPRPGDGEDPDPDDPTGGERPDDEDPPLITDDPGPEDPGVTAQIPGDDSDPVGGNDVNGPGRPLSLHGSGCNNIGLASHQVADWSVWLGMILTGLPLIRRRLKS